MNSQKETDNIVNSADGGYDNVSEFIPIAQPTADTLTKLASLQASDVAGDRLSFSPCSSLTSLTPCSAIDALIVGAETLSNYLRTKRTWTGRIVLLTDGESPMEIENWESIAKKLSKFEYRITIMYDFPISSRVFLTVRSGVDFDDDEIDFKEEGKPHIKVTQRDSDSTQVI